MKFVRPPGWWLLKAMEEDCTVGAGSRPARSLKTLSPLKFTPEQKRALRKLAKRRRYDPDYVVGGPQMPWWRKLWRRARRAVEAMRTLKDARDE